MTRGAVNWVAVASAVLLSAASGSAGPLAQEWSTGVAVPYGGPTDGQEPHIPFGGVKAGSCGYGELDPQAWPFWAAVAVGPTHPLALASRHPLLGCGACIEVQCDSRSGFQGCPATANSTSLVALITDTCVDCPPDKITLHYLSFQQRLASPDIGEVNIRFRQVECDAPGPIVADIDTYRATEGGYLRLSLESVAGTGSIQTIELRKSPLAGDRLSLAGTTWTPMKNSWGAKWELSGLPEGTLDMRITSDKGEALVARQAITQAGVTGKLALPVQFSTSEVAGIVDAQTTATILPAQPSTCNTTILAMLRTLPDMNTMLAHLQTAGMLTLLEDPTATVTIFAPTDAAWLGVDAKVDLTDKETLQETLTFLIAQGQVAVPTASQMLPEDLADGGVRVAVDTLNGMPLQVFAGPGGIVLRDGSALTPDAIIVSANNLVCDRSVVNVVTNVPLPFSM